MAAESTSAAVILASSHLGFALSTTHVATGSILGTGVGKKGAQVNWGVAVMWCIGHLIGGVAGPIAVFLILAVLATFRYLRSRLQPINADNVNDEWEGGLAPAVKNADLEKVS